MLTEAVVPLDDNFPAAVEQWEQAGNDLAMATYDDLLPVTDSSPTGTHQQPPEASSSTSSSNQNLKFTATPINTGGRPGKHIPIRPTRRRTYREAVLAPPASQNSVPDPPSPQVLFRKFKAKPKATTSRPVPAPTSHRTAIQDPVPARDSASIAAALNLEDYPLFHSNFEAWEDKWYQLRHDEALVGTEMITQLARTLELGTYAIANQGDSLKHFLDQVNMEDVHNRSDVLAMFDPTCLLAQILTSSPAPGELQHVLILRLRNSHWMLVHFQLDDRIISTIDSLPQKHSHHPDLSELGDYVKLANILADTMNPHDPVSTAHQQPVFPQSGMVANLSCGFWAFIYAILISLDAPIPASMSLGLVKQTLKSLLVDYKTNAAGGLSQDMVVACLSDLVPNFRVRFAHMEDLELWAPEVPEGPDDPTFQLVQQDAQMDTALSVVDSQGSHDHTNKLHKACRTSQHKQLKYKYGSAKVPHVHWLSLQQSHWISSGLLDFMCATTTSADDGLWCLSTAFMPQLKESYQQVSRLRPYGRVNKEPVSILGDVKCLFIPFNEPITGMKEMPSAADSDEHVTGSHWAALVVKPQQRLVVYKSSLLNMKAAGEAIKVDQFSQVDTMLTAGLKLIKVYLSGLPTHRKSDRGKYNEQLWSFDISESTPQQSNVFDCGAFVLSYMMECHLGQDLGWNNTQFGILRKRLAVQILEGNSALSSLIEQTQSDNLAPPKLDAIMTPNRKRHQSQTTTTSPEAALKLNKPFFTGAIPKHAQRVKRLKMADFPVKAPALVHTSHTTKATSSSDLSHMERVLAFKPMSTSSSPESGPKKDTGECNSTG
ncbi:Smt3-specific protease [Ceratobasidium sp. 395]|nr:Smt3-specific protease [Ceratobasidium sp. 395]